MFFSLSLQNQQRTLDTFFINTNTVYWTQTLKFSRTIIKMIWCFATIRRPTIYSYWDRREQLHFLLSLHTTSSSSRFKRIISQSLVWSSVKRFAKKLAQLPLQFDINHALLLLEFYLINEPLITLKIIIINNIVVLLLPFLANPKVKEFIINLILPKNSLFVIP